MGCGNSTIRRVHPASGDGETSPRSASSQRSPSPREAVPTVSTATQTPPLTIEEDENKGEMSSDELSHEPNNELAHQPSGSERDNVEVEDKGKSGSATNGSDLKNGNERMETAAVGEEREDARLKQVDQQEEDLEVKPVVRIHISKVDSIDIREEEGEDTTSGPGEKPDEKKDSDMTDGGEPATVSSEEISVKDPSPIPIPDSKEIDKEVTAVVESKDLEHKEEEKQPQGTNQAEERMDQAEKGTDQTEEASNSAAVDEGIEDPSSEKDVDIGDSMPSQHNPPDPLAKASHPLKPLPDFDDGITVTKSEPRLPLLPPIGSKKMHPLQTSKGVAALTSQSETVLHTSENVATKDAKEGAKEKRKGGDSVPQSKKKSAGSLRSSSGSSISKSKKASSSSSSATSLRSKSKSKESLKSGSQGHNSAKSRNSDSLSNGASKKLTRSRESIKAASHVYSSTPPPKSAESVKKGDAGKSGHTSKTKEPSTERDSEENKHDSAEKEAAVPTSVGKEGAGEDGGINQVEEVSKEKDVAVKEKQPEQSTEESSVQEQQSTSAKESPNKSDVVDSQLADEKVEKEKETKTQCNEDAKSLPSAPNDQNTDVEASPQDDKGQDVVEVADSQAKEENPTMQQEKPSKPHTPNLLPNEKALPSVDDEDKISLTSPTDSNRKLEIDKKTGQSEQSIVEAVEKSREQVQ